MKRLPACLQISLTLQAEFDVSEKTAKGQEKVRFFVSFGNKPQSPLIALQLLQATQPAKVLD